MRTTSKLKCGALKVGNAGCNACVYKNFKTYNFACQQVETWNIDCILTVLFLLLMFVSVVVVSQTGFLIS